MFRRTFQGNAPYLTFTADWQQIPFGHLVPGQTVRINYDPNRLPQERSYYNGSPTWFITVFYQFASNGAVQSQQLDMPAGVAPARYANDPVEASFMTAAIDIPNDAEELIVWFMNTGQSGLQYWDSDYGANYIFRFTSIDIQGEEANVTSDPQTPYSGFNVSMTALPEVENVSVSFKVTNNPPDNPFESTVDLSAGELTNGRRAWSAAGILVPYQARIRFSFNYTVNGRTFVDDNDGTGFWAPKPLPTHDPQKFTAAVKAAQ
ncbi:MAG TPA: DUF6209 family protein [Thermoanaerobaculia bacterium]|jgi:hypothetical protein